MSRQNHSGFRFPTCSRAITTASSKTSLSALASKANRLLKKIAPAGGPSPAIVLQEASAALLDMSADPRSELRTMIENSTTQVDSTVQQKHIRTIHQVFISVTERCLDCCREHRENTTQTDAMLRTVVDLFHRARHLGLNFHRPLYQELMVELVQNVADDRHQPYTMIREIASSHADETILCYRTAIIALLECGHDFHAHNLLEVMSLVYKIPLDETSVGEIYRLLLRITNDAFAREEKEGQVVVMAAIVESLQFSVCCILSKRTRDAEPVQGHRENRTPQRDAKSEARPLERALELMDAVEAGENLEDDSDMESDDDEDYDSELHDDTEHLSGSDDSVIHFDDTDEASDEDDDDEEFTYAMNAIGLSKAEAKLLRNVKSARVRDYFSMLTAESQERHLSTKAIRSAVKAGFKESLEADDENDVSDRSNWKIPDVTVQLEACNEGDKLSLTTTFADYLWDQAEHDEESTRGIK